MVEILDSDNAKAIKLCLSCSRTCLETLHHCLKEGRGRAANSMPLSLLQQCADACLLSARLMIAESEFHQQSCVLSFELCRACAEECERYEEDPVMVRCANICRKCEESCRGMSGVTTRVYQKEDYSFRASL